MPTTSAAQPGLSPEEKELLEFEPSHPYLPIDETLRVISPLPPKVRREKLILRRSAILAARDDPYNFEFQLPIWKLVERQIAELRGKFPKGVIKLIIFGGNRSAKSRFGGRHVVTDCVRNPGRTWWCCDSTEAMARANQMRYVWNFIPIDFKTAPTDKVTNIKYSLAGGFTENQLIMPNSSQIAFKFYSMKETDLPGPELDGIWADELIPLNWIDILIYRLTNRNGILIITFTPETGWTETVSHYVEGAHVIDWVDAPLLPKVNRKGKVIGYEQVPRVMQCSDPTARIIFFHTSDNPFGNYESLAQELVQKKAGRSEILIRAYGVAEKGAFAAFPRFHHKWHVITPEDFAKLEKEFPNAERYQMVDPCSGRNWFVIYVFCPAPNRWIVYREWPSYGHPGAFIERFGDPGPWAVVGKDPDGAMGPAQKTFGFGLRDYKALFSGMEGKEEITERWIDSRYAQASVLSHESTTTLQEQLTEVGLDFRAMTASNNPILGQRNDGSIDLINSALEYDEDTEKGKFSKKLGRLNVPQLQIVDTCPNTIYALRTWTGQDGQRGATKDPIDVLRGLFMSMVGYVGEDAYTWKR